MSQRILASALVLLGMAGCPKTKDSDDDGSGTVDLGAEPDLGCYTQPRTHVEILNACTDAQSIEKSPMLPLLRPDGTLPPLP